MGTVSLIAGLAAVAASAWLVAASLGLTRAVDFLLAVYLVATAEIVLLCLALSPGEMLTRGWLLGSSALVLAAAALLWHVRGRPPPPPVRAAATACQDALRDLPVAILAGVVTLALAYAAALAVATPHSDFDVNWYHLARAAFWRQDQVVGYIPHANNMRLNAFPPGAEIVSSWTMILYGNDRFAGLFQLVALMATMVAIVGIGRRLGLDRGAAAFGALLFATLPVVALQASTALNDIAVASLLVITVYFVLSTTRAALCLAALALALALATKVTALVALPLLAVLVVCVNPRRRWPVLAAFGGAAIAVGGLWYALNVAEEGSWLPEIDQVTGSQAYDLPALRRTAQLARLAIDAVDPTGSVGRDRYLYAAAAAVLLAIGAAAAVRARSRATALAGAVAAAVALAPLAFPTVQSTLLRGYQSILLDLGHDRLAFLAWGRNPDAPSAVGSWYGPLGLLALVATLPLAVGGVRRGTLPAVALFLLLAPVFYAVVVVAASGYSEFHGRYLMPAVALATATWGLLLRLRSLAWAMSAIASITLALTMIHNTEKPAGFSVLGGTALPSVWTQSRIDLLARQGPLRAYERRVADGEVVALRLRPYDLSYPFFGANLEHHIVFVGDSDKGLARRVDWLVVAPGLTVDVCAAGWSKVPTGNPQWQLYRRVGPCPDDSSAS